MADFYRDLGVPKNASPGDIKKAYRALAAKLHPDKNPGDAKAEARFKVVNRAHQVLSDPKQRALYDEFGEEGLREGFDPAMARAWGARQRGAGGGRRGRAAPAGGEAAFDLEELLRGAGGGGRRGGGVEDLFGDFLGGGMRRNARGGADIEAEVEVDFVQAVAGATLELVLRGSEEPITVRIPAGAAEGDRLRVQGQGGTVPGRPRGDLLVTLRVKPHPLFQREGLDLTLEVPITAGEAYGGGKVKVPTPHGEVTLRVPEHARSGQTVRLKGKGVHRQGKAGDLFVKFLVQLPAAEADEVREAIAVLERHQTEDLRAGLRWG